MAKATRPRARMDRYFKHLQRNSYILSYNKKGSHITKIKKWDLIRRLTKKIHSEDELSGIKVPEEARYLDSAVKYLPRQDVILYGMIPALEQRVYSICKNCSRVFNPRDILSHRACTKSDTPHSGPLKKKVKSKNVNSKSLSSNGSSSSHSLNNTSPVQPSSSSLSKDPVKDFEFKRPHTPPPKQVRKPSEGETFLPTTKTSKSASVSTSTNAPPATTSSDKSDIKASSSKTSSHHNPSSSWSKHYSSKSFSSHNSDEVFRFGKLGMTVAARRQNEKSSSGKDEKESAKVMTNGCIAQAKNLENTQDDPPVVTDPVLIVPASPVSVVSSVQLLEIGNNIMSLESPQSASNPQVRKQMVLPVSSNHTRAIRMYKSHPKPTVFPNFGARRLGGAILLSNPLITDQRNDLLSVINGDSKGLVQDVNGFILHADVSQTVEAQQFSEENSPSQHKFIISLIKKHGF